MDWKVLNCFLLVTLASASPNGRHKRNFAYIKDFITSALFEESRTNAPETINLKPDQEYQFYKIPGYDNILIKASPFRSVIRKSSENESRQMLNIHPFESFLGTKNSIGTLNAFENVNNLLSTEIFNGEESSLLKEVIAPMIADTLTFVAGDDLRPISNVSNMSPHLNNKATEDKRKQSENNKDSKRFTNHNIINATMTENIETISVLPKCDQRTVEMVTFNKIANDSQASSTQNLNAINQSYSTGDSLIVTKFNRIKSNSSKDQKTQENVIKHLFDLNAVNKDFLDSDRNAERIQDKIAIDKILGATLSHSISTADIPTDREADGNNLRLEVTNDTFKTSDENGNRTYAVVKSNNTTENRRKIETKENSTKENYLKVERNADNISIQNKVLQYISTQHVRNNSYTFQEIEEKKSKVPTDSAVSTTTNIVPWESYKSTEKKKHFPGKDYDNRQAVAKGKVNHQNKVNYSSNKEVKESNNGSNLRGNGQSIKGRGDIPEESNEINEINK